jgi:hypothetical protein
MTRIIRLGQCYLPHSPRGSRLQASLQKQTHNNTIYPQHSANRQPQSSVIVLISMQWKHLEETEAVPLFSVSTYEERIFDGWHLSSIDNRCCLSPVPIVGRSSIVVAPSLPSRKSLRGRESKGFNRIRISPTLQNEAVRNYGVKVLWLLLQGYSHVLAVFM